MKKRARLTIRVKLAIMSMITIAVAVSTLGIVLAVSFSNVAFQTASTTLEGVAENAAIALENSILSAEKSTKLLTNQIGYNHNFANSIVNCKDDDAAKEAVKKAMAGDNLSGDGSTIIGAMDYLVISDPDIDSATMYSPYVDDVQGIHSRLFPTSQSQIECTEARYNALIANPGQSFWFFGEKEEDGKTKQYLYVWKAVVNFGVSDSDAMDVVGYIEYGFNRANFLSCLTDTQYKNEGMLLLDENNQKVLDVSSGLAGVDNKASSSIASLKSGTKRYGNYTASKIQIKNQKWTYVAFINHRDIERTNIRSAILTAAIVLASVIVAAAVAFLLTAKEIKRIKNLSKAAGAISEGDYDVRLKKEANDEITDVSESFNTMAEKVQDALKELILQQDSISENFATILSNKSGESGNHVKRVSEYSAVLAKEMGFNENEVHDIRIASMLHDVGKIMIDESILHKPGRFTDEEYKIMQQHVAYGGKLLQGVPGNIMQLGAIIALYHHERWDGNGYVHGLKGDDIPKEAQITSVADVFDALVSKRCYKGPWTIEDAYNEIVSQSGKQFAPAAVEAFKKRFEDFKHISEIYKDEE